MGAIALQVHDLRFRYPRTTEELYDGLTHDFTPGAVTALMGPSGCGKSTLLYVLGLLLTPSSGTVAIGGADSSHLSDAQRSRLRANRIGFVFQDSELDPTRKVIDSVIEPALYAGRSRDELLPRARELLSRFGLAERAEHLPGQISGGQAQRFAICRALLNEPDIVLCDEPTGNLDPGNAELVLQALIQAAHEDGNTVVIATHDTFVEEHSDEVVRLK